jgi:ribosome-associated protein
MPVSPWIITVMPRMKNLSSGYLASMSSSPSKILLICTLYATMFLMRVTEDMVHFKAARSHKPGGMGRDHRSTKVHMWVTVDDLPFDSQEKKLVRQKLAHHINHNDELWVESEEERSQELNRDRALERLNQLLEEALHTDAPRLPTEPTRSSDERRLHDKHHHGRVKASRHSPHHSDSV